MDPAIARQWGRILRSCSAVNVTTLTLPFYQVRCASNVTLFMRHAFRSKRYPQLPKARASVAIGSESNQWFVFGVIVTNATGSKWNSKSALLITYREYRRYAVCISIRPISQVALSPVHVSLPILIVETLGHTTTVDVLWGGVPSIVTVRQSMGRCCCLPLLVTWMRAS